MIVKVCGVCDASVADAAIDAGADWLGLVLEPRSPRFVEDALARALAAHVCGRADLIGVFVEPAVELCEEAAGRYGLAAVQVHGDVHPEFSAACAVPVIRGFNVRSRHEAMTLQWWPDCLVLLDAGRDGPGLPGGTGRRLDPGWAAEVARHRRILLAGGLGPDDVAAAVRQVRPEGVDASSRLETSPGVKDPKLVQRFVSAARAAFDGVAPSSRME